MPPAFRDRNILRWLGAYTSSVTGDVIYYTALTWAVTRSAGPAAAGVVLAAGAIPRAVLMPAGGVLADRFGPRRVLIGSDVVRCVAVLAVAAATYADGPHLGFLLLLAGCFGAVDAVFMPAVGALPPCLTESHQLVRVQGMRTLAVRLANAAGPLAAALILTASGASGAFATVGLLFALSLALLAAVRVPTPPTHADSAGRTSPWAELLDGLRYLKERRALTRLVAVIALGELCFSGPVGAGLVLLVDERGWGAAELALPLAAFSVGGAATGLALTVARAVPRAGAAVAGSLLVTAVLVTALAAPGATPGGVAALCAALGAASGISMVMGQALLQKETEARYVGRVTAVTTLCTLGLSPLVYPVVGFVAATWGTGVFFAACGAVCLLAAGVAATPEVRSARL
ncbi:MFS transporter [Streptomyces antnestii]|uniref:MFS transporter n=1 Tax=Streptomyces antnestii TaxID=2494256 RepID=A0A3S2VGP9_9ACTN|nr:MFS transporter [Streptomyces sp. San01]RVU22751.1 MFS transporter [Streptomyces sp. San01]